jgi:hypothetical protein
MAGFEHRTHAAFAKLFQQDVIAQKEVGGAAFEKHCFLKRSDRAAFDKSAAETLGWLRGGLRQLLSEIGTPMFFEKWKRGECLDKLNGGG